MAKKKKRTAKTAPASKPASRPAGKLDTLSTEALQAELRRRETGIRRLEKRRERLLEQLNEVESELASVGAPITSAGGVRKRPKNDSNLEEALIGVLTGSTMGVTEVADAVQKAGYRTSSANFRTIVNQTLLRSSGIKRVARGQYTAK